MQNPELVTADDLNSWADNDARDAQENFPRLVRRLLQETPGVSGVSVRAGNGVSQPGYDGVAQSDGTASVLPRGSLVFEFGTSENVQKKASADYRKRAANADVSGSFFIFVTPRRWGNKDKWLAKRRNENKFAGVWVLDADDLEGWLEASSTTHHWISEHLGRQPSDAQTLECWWQNFQKATQPKLPLGMFVAGREKTREDFLKVLDENPKTVTIQADWCKDCLAFMYASIVGDPDDHSNNSVPPAIIVKSAAAWNRIARQAGACILIPLFEDVDEQVAHENGHHVIWIVDRERVILKTKNSLRLPRVSRLDVTKILNDCGINSQKSYHLAGLARRNMPSFVRALTQNVSIQKPLWATNADAPILAGLALVGAWDSSNLKDMQAIAALVGDDYKTVTSLCERLSEGSDPVMSQAGPAWRFSSLEEAFLCLSSRIGDTVMEKWKQLALEALLEANPTYGLTQVEKVALCFNKQDFPLQYSEELKSGIARSLAMVGAIEADDAQPRKLKDVVASIVQELLNQAETDETGRVWNLLAPHLPSLAEAEPRQFIDTVMENLEQGESSLLRAFNEDKDDLFFGDPSFHPHLLWALEVLAWPEEYFSDSIECLARLAAQQPKSRQHGNRPDESLAAILCGWSNGTTVSRENRLKAIDDIKKISPAIGWDLLFRLWPNSGLTIIPPAAPRYREDWCPLTDAPVLWSEWDEFRHGLVELAFSWQDFAPSHLEQLVRGITVGLLPEDRIRIFDHLERLVIRGDIDENCRYLVWRALRALAAKHSHHRKNWSLPEKDIERLVSLTDEWQPASLVLRYVYLFNHDPGLLDCALHIDSERYEQTLEERRKGALSEILAAPQAIGNLTLLASEAGDSWRLGEMLAGLSRLEFWDIAQWIDSENEKLATVMDAYLYRALNLRSVSWLKDVLDDSRLTASQRTAVLRWVPVRQDFWEILRCNREDEDVYWRTVKLHVLPPENMRYAIARLVACGRAWDAIDVVFLSIYAAKRDGVATDLTVDVLSGLLRGACAQRSDRVSSLYYQVGKLLDHLVEMKADVGDVARLELLLYPLLGHHREPVALNQILATDSTLFVKLVEVVRGGETLFELDQGAAFVLANSAVDGWRGCPGLTTDGTFDASAMRQWMASARIAFAKAGLSEVGDFYLGKVLGCSPKSADGAWPLPAVCDLIDEINDAHFDEGLVAEMCSALSSSVRGIYEGGRQEREIAQRYRTWSKQIRPRSRHTARLLKQAAEMYEKRAEHEDEQAELREEEL